MYANIYKFSCIFCRNPYTPPAYLPGIIQKSYRKCKFFVGVYVFFFLNLSMKFDFIGSRSKFYIGSLILAVISLLAWLMLPLHLGIDMTGGIHIEYQYAHDISLADIRAKVDALAKTSTLSGTQIINNTTVYTVSGNKNFVVEVGFHQPTGASEQDFDAAKIKYKDTLTKELDTMSKSDITLTSYQNIGESFGDYIKQTAYLTLIIAVIAISCYIAYAFSGSIEGVTSFSFASVTMASLVHDIVITAGLYLITSFFFPEFKVDTFFITAMLTVLGYSVNDTIVIMDRIRSNLVLPENRKRSIGDLINVSVQDTMTRSLYTSFTIILVLIAMFFFGPDSIRGFILALLYGTVIGAYSSICIAAMLLYDFEQKFAPHKVVSKKAA